VGDLLAEVIFGRRRDAEIAGAHIGAVEIELEDFVLGVVPFQPDGEEGFLDLALDRALGAEEQVLGQLLGDRRAALRAVVALRVIDEGAQGAEYVDAEMVVEAPVLGGDGGLDEIVGQLAQRIGIIGADAALADLVAVAVEEGDRNIFGFVELARLHGIERRQRQRQHQHRADGEEGGAVGQNFDEEAAQAAYPEIGEEVLDVAVAAAEGVKELVDRRIEPRVGIEHALGLAALLFVVERILQPGLRTGLARSTITTFNTANIWPSGTTKRWRRCLPPNGRHSATAAAAAA